MLPPFSTVVPTFTTYKLPDWSIVIPLGIETFVVRMILFVADTAPDPAFFTSIT